MSPGRMCSAQLGIRCASSWVVWSSMSLSDHSSRSRSKAADGTATGPRVALMRSLRGWSGGVALKTARRLKDSSSTRL